MKNKATKPKLVTGVGQMKQISTKKDIKEVKLAGIIIMFALLAYASPTIWHRYDLLTTSAANSEKSDFERPKPKPEYTLKTFFALLDDYSIQEAMSLMDPEMIKFDKAIWEEDFQNIYFIKLRNFQEVPVEKKNENIKTYRARLDVRLKTERLKSAWENGENIRLVTLKYIQNEWRITEIKTAK